MKHILVEIFVVLNSSFIVRKPFRKRGSFLWIFLANLRGYWVVRCGQSVRLCRSARLWVDFGELRCSWPDGGQKIELPTGGQESGRDLNPEIILLHFYSHRVLQIWHFSKLFGQDHFRLKHGLQSVHVTSLWVESAGLPDKERLLCLVNRADLCLDCSWISKH